MLSNAIVMYVRLSENDYSHKLIFAVCMKMLEGARINAQRLDETDIEEIYKIYFMNEVYESFLVFLLPQLFESFYF